MTRTWTQPQDAAGFASQWRRRGARGAGLGRRAGAERYLEVRYEELVGDAESELRRICVASAWHTRTRCSITPPTSTSRPSRTNSASGGLRRRACATGATRCPRRMRLRSTASPATCWDELGYELHERAGRSRRVTRRLRRACRGLAGGQLRAAALAAMARVLTAPALTSSPAAGASHAGARGSAGSGARATPSHPVEREEVVTLGDDSRRVLPDGQPPEDLAVPTLASQTSGPRASR